MALSNKALKIIDAAILEADGAVISIHSDSGNIVLNVNGTDFPIVNTVKKKATTWDVSSYLRTFGEGIPHEIYERGNEFVYSWPDFKHAFAHDIDIPGQTIEQRMEIVKAGVEEIKKGMTSQAICTHQDPDTGKWFLRIEVGLAEGPVAKFADMVFHGSANAAKVNGTLFLFGGLNRLLEAAEKPVTHKVVLAEGIEIGAFAVDSMNHVFYVNPETKLDELTEAIDRSGVEIEWKLVPREE